MFTTSLFQQKMFEVLEIDIWELYSLSVRISFLMSFLRMQESH